MRWNRKDRCLPALLVLLTVSSLALALGCFLLVSGECTPTPPEAVSQSPPELERLLGENYISFLSDTILMQMGNRMQKDSSVRFYPIDDRKPLNTYCPIGPNTEYLVDEDGYLVILLPAGAVTEAEHGVQRFRVARLDYSREKPESPPPPAGWNLLLVNPWNPLPEDFTVALTQLGEDQAVDSRIYPELMAMLDDARAQGLSPVVCSSYRTQELQEALYADKIQRLMNQGCTQAEAEAEAGRWVAVPGTSEHQAGLALDIVAQSYPQLDEAQENTPEQQWLMANAHRYGFILRYPEEKSYLTGIGYEPWHYRYVGREAAEEIYGRGICLEEYLTSQ